MKVEVFTAGCKFCSSVETQVREAVTDQHEVVVYNLGNSDAYNEYSKKAERYGIKSLPSVVVDGNLLSCCKQNGFRKEQLVAALS
ncbi:hypothetical protein BMS3Abin03_02143 [bacterium BMS3Abin03]|nr:hypothetical protein BMS3Abin03_02143 [bacterium BMS3Abin03]